MASSQPQRSGVMMTKQPPQATANPHNQMPATFAEFQARLAKRGKARFAAGLIEGVAAMLQPGDVVCDCGANVGSVSGVLLGSGAQVHAFEPDPHAGKILMEKFGHLPNFTLHAVAVGTAAGKASFYRSESNDVPGRSGAAHTLFDKSRFVQNNPDRSKIEVDVIDFPAFLTDILDSGHALPFVKLDVEGAELGIIRRMLDTALFDRIRLTLAETHERIIPDWADDYAQLRRDVAARYPKTRVNLDWI